MFELLVIFMLQFYAFIKMILSQLLKETIKYLKMYMKYLNYNNKYYFGDIGVLLHVKSDFYN